MSSDKLTSAAPTNPHRWIVWLVVAHVVVGLVGAAYLAESSKTLRSTTFLGIVLSQTSLLGIWGGLGSSPWWKRVIGVVVGVGYLALLLGVGISDLSLRMFLVVVLATAFVATPLLVVRFFKVAVQLVPAPVAAVGGIQFSIRHLMILTFVVACLMTIAEWVQPYLPHGEMFYRSLLIGVTFGLVGVLPVCFILAMRRPLLYSVGLVAVGACAGYCLARIGDDNVGIWMTATGTEATAAVASLLVVRSCGYRLVRLPPRRQEGVEPGNQTCQATTT